MKLLCQSGMEGSIAAKFRHQREVADRGRPSPLHVPPRAARDLASWPAARRLEGVPAASPNSPDHFSLCRAHQRRKNAAPPRYRDHQRARPAVSSRLSPIPSARSFHTQPFSFSTIWSSEPSRGKDLELVLPLPPWATPLPELGAPWLG
jgi:hypothetical protein